MDQHTTTMFVIVVVAVAAPLLVRGASRFVRLPVVVCELVLGIIIGPSVLGWALPSEFVGHLSDYGLAMLFFMAGSEIEIGALRGRTGRRAIGGWLVSLALGVALGLLLVPGEGGIVIGIALASTALGALIPILRDQGELSTPFGRSVSAVGAIGEFGPLIAISIFLGGRAPGVSTLVLGAFVLVAAIAIVIALRVPRGRFHRAVTASLHTSGQFAVRVLFLILSGLVAVSLLLDLDMLLGAFVAGVVWKLLMRDAPLRDRDAVESKVEAVAFGFLIPIFFVYTGVTFNLGTLLATPALFLAVGVVLVVLLVVRGIPASFAAPPGATRHDRVSLALLGATALPVIVAVTQIGIDERLIPAEAQPVLVGGGMLSVLLFPVLAAAVRRGRTGPADAPAESADRPPLGETV